MYRQKAPSERGCRDGLEGGKCGNTKAKVHSFIPNAELSCYAEKGRVVPELEKKSITDYRELIEGNYRMIYHTRERDVFLLAIIDGRRNFEEIILKKLMRI